MSKPSGVNEGERRALPLWAKISSFIIASMFLVFLIRAVNQIQWHAIKIGKAAPEFTLTTFNNETVKLSDLRGKQVLINFWASWCTECNGEAQIIQKVWQELQTEDSIVFLGVDFSDTEKEARQFIQENGITYVNGPDLRSKISGLYNVTGVPETYLVDDQGNLQKVKVGPFTSVEELQTFLQKE